MASCLAFNEISFYALDVDTSLASNILLKIFDVLCIKDDKFSILNLDCTICLLVLNSNQAVGNHQI